MGQEFDNSTTGKDLPSFIKSLPIGKDLLEGKAQEQIAENIACLIKDNQAENKLVGLDGPWGSGKSNLVKILESRLSDTHHFFIYDAWGHQEDLQRRAFLEELTADLCSEKLIDPDSWKPKLKDLLSRKREVSTKTIPHLSIGVIATIFAVVLTPIFQALAGWVENLWCKLLITAIPFLSAIAIYCFTPKKDGHGFFSDMYVFYKDKELSNETHVTVSEKEPSVRGFQKWMGDLSSSLVGKKLVVVFDNMDRLPPDKVRELWSSIHTFFC